MVRCRAKGENYSYDFAASLQNTNGQSILISERDLTAWKGAAERMLTNEIVLKVFSDYLAANCFGLPDHLRHSKKGHRILKNGMVGLRIIICNRRRVHRHFMASLPNGRLAGSGIRNGEFVIFGMFWLIDEITLLIRGKAWS